MSKTGPYNPKKNRVVRRQRPLYGPVSRFDGARVIRRSGGRNRSKYTPLTRK